MKDLLLLVHRIPFPPNKGDKIRSYHLLAHLAKRFRVHLGTFVDDENDWQYVDKVKRLCGETNFCKLDPLASRLRSAKALTTGRPLSLDYYRDGRMQIWVSELLQRRRVERIIVFSSAMAQYVEYASGAVRIIDFVDVDSDKWTQYAKGKAWPLSWLYRREGRALLRYEGRVAQTFDASLFVSAAEAELFGRLAPHCAQRVSYYSNGVDTTYFSPDRAYTNPFGADELPIVFTGAMDYWPNVDAVQRFAANTLPTVRERHPNAVFYIVGSRPTEQVKALAGLAGVKVTGSVPDVRPYIAHARVTVAPLRIARGIQNKVLEAMAMGKAIIVSPAALEGIDASPDRELLLAGSDKQFIDSTCALLGASPPDIGCAARRKVVDCYGWSSNLQKIDCLLDASPTPSTAAAGQLASALRLAGERA